MASAWKDNTSSLHIHHLFSCPRFRFLLFYFIQNFTFFPWQFLKKTMLARESWHLSHANQNMADSDWLLLVLRLPYDTELVCPTLSSWHEFNSDPVLRCFNAQPYYVGLLDAIIYFISNGFVLNEKLKLIDLTWCCCLYIQI